MDVWEAFEKGYELMGTTCFADDAVEMANDFKKYYDEVFWGRYKRTIGNDDAYAIMCRGFK